MNDDILYIDTSTVLPNKIFLNMLYGKFAMPVKNIIMVDLKYIK